MSLNGLDGIFLGINDLRANAYLINPTVVDARSEVTTQLLSDEGFVVEFTDT